MGNPFKIIEDGQNLSAYERNRLFVNLGGTGFVDLSHASATDIDSDSRSVMVADFDGDRAVDLLVAGVGGGPLRLFRNRIPADANRVHLILVGSESNRSAIGSRVTAYCGNRMIVRDVFSANGFMGQSPPQLILGVGEAEIIDRLVIRWPSGQVQTLEDVPVVGTLTVTEGQPGYESRTAGDTQPRQGRG